MTERDLFVAAFHIGDPEERQRYLDEACGPDAAVRRRVEALLALAEGAGSFLEQPVPASGETASFNTDAATSPYGPPDAVEAGTVIAGRYKLLEEIGEGGMGTVWMAEQTEPVQRRVAVKLIKPGMDSRQVVGRFEAERQALALMDHPNIAKVFDGGYVGCSLREQPADSRSESATFGRPFFVMELVKGTPITKYCDEKKLPVRERLELFADVCRAVQHAHQKGIIHRDLKPSNVMVAPYDGRAVVKVIDFGVAKAAGQKLTEATLFTGFGAVVGTPEYMSPEQAELNNADIDTRSDIYSLGVLLYELLTGTTPLTRQRLKNAALLEVLRVIREEEPPRPSTRLSTTDELPSIAAVRGVEPAKLSRLVRGELDWIVMKSLEKDRTRRYETANGLAADVQRYLADEPVHACPPSVGYRLRKFARRNRRALATGSVLAVGLLVSVGSVAGSVGWAARDRAARQAAVEKEAELALREAERWADQENWPQALAAAKRGEGLLAGTGGDLRGRLLDLRNDLEMLLRLEDIHLQVADLRNGWHEWDEVHDGFVRAFADYGIDVLHAPADTAATSLRAHDRLAVSLAVALDIWACGASPKTDAKRAHLRAVAAAIDPDAWRCQIRDALVRHDGPTLSRLAASPDLARQPRNSLIMLEHGLRHCGNPKLALEVRRLTQRLHPADFWANYMLAHELFWLPNADFAEVVLFARAAVIARPKSAGAHLLLALALQRLRRLDEAVSHHLEAIALAPSNPFAHHDYGGTLYIQGRYDEALATYQKAIDLWPGNFHAYHFRGNTHRDFDKLDKAVADYRKSIELNPSGPYADSVHLALGKTLLAQGKQDEAIDAYLRYAILCPHVWDAAKPFCAAVRATKPRDEAVAYFEAVSDQNRNSYRLQYHIAFAFGEMGEHERAVARYQRALEIQPNSAHALHNIGAILRQQKKYDEALVYFDLAIAIDPKDLWAVLGRGVTLRITGDLRAAADAFRRAIEIDANSADAHLYLADLLFDQGDGPDAFLSYRQGLRLAARRGGLGVENFHSRLARTSLRLALASDPNLRHPALAVEFARESLRVKEIPDRVSTLGVTYYRAGSYPAAVAVLEQAIKLRGGRDGRDEFYLALANHQLDRTAEARRWYESAVAWAGKHKPKDAELRKLRTEAGMLLGVAGVGSAPPPR